MRAEDKRLAAICEARKNQDSGPIVPFNLQANAFLCD